MITPVGTPASTIARIASTRRSGCGVPGSVTRQACSSTVAIENETLTSSRCAAGAIRSRSRVTSGDFVRIENGVSASTNAPMMPRVSLNFASARWYGSVFVPIATFSCAHFGFASSRRSTSTALILTTILVSKSLPALRPRYSWVGRAKQ